MLKNKNIICISSIDWDFIWQGHQEIMSTFCNNSNRALFIENTGVRTPGIRDISRIKNRIKNWSAGVKGIRERMDNLYVFSPLILPFPYLRIANWINRHLILSVLDKWIKIMDFSDPIIWVFLPTPLSMGLISNLKHKIVVYYCIDNFRVGSVAAKKIKKSEIRLLKNADLVFTTSKELHNYCSLHNKNVYKFPFAVNFQKFQDARLKKPDTPPEIQGMKRPIIGYIGGIHKWIDFNLIKETAQHYPQYSFVFVGPIQTDVSFLASLKNVFFLGAKGHEQVPAFIINFDICLIPYLLADYTKNVYPTKLNEYHSLGKPVLSTALPEVIDFNKENEGLVFVAKDYEEFINFIPKIINNDSDTLINKRISSAKKNSWDLKIEEMSVLIDKEIDRKSLEPVDWQVSLIMIYKTWRRKTIKITALISIIYLLLFYTPLIWFMAKPLRISQLPRKSDCIVVFAGGVGESGMAGQGYEERVQYAVELYKRGFARHIIFSSGHTYLFEEPLIMKALAVSLGIPEEAIFLEDKSKNTYENVEFSKSILEKNKWREILLVSSPYHMRRVSLVVKKNAPEIRAVYTPIPKSLFYGQSNNVKGKIMHKQINTEQIKGLLHEILGIIYYWHKGWI